MPELSGKGKERGVVTFIFAAFVDVRVFGRLVVTWVRLAHFAWCRCFRWIVFFVCGTTESRLVSDRGAVPYDSCTHATASAMLQATCQLQALLHALTQVQALRHIIGHTPC